MVTYAGALSVHVVTSIGTKKGPTVNGGFDNFSILYYVLN